MNNLHPIISIIVPVYNTEQYLAKCLDSIVAQTFTDFEVLMIDDGSTDGSGEICDRYSQSDSRFIAIHQTNQGVSASRNNGLNRAQGRYISFVDSDDYIHPQMLELLYEAIRKGDYGFSMASYRMVNIDVTVKFQSVTSLNVNELTAPKAMCKLFGNSNEDVAYIICCNKLYDSRFLRNIRFADFKVSEDLLFHVELLSRIRKAVEIKDVIYYYVQRNTSASHHVSRRHVTDRIKAFCECLNLLSPVSLEEACCVTKLYKVLFRSRFQVEKESYRNDVLVLIKEVHRQIFKRFLRSKYISVFIKVLFMGFFYCPLLYRAFVIFCELKTRKA